MLLRNDVQLGRTAPCDHQVTFYEDDQFLVESTVAFLADALRVGVPAIAVATREHLAAIETALSGLTADLPQDSQQGLFIGVDAHDLLDRIVVDGHPDPSAFEAAAREMLDQLPQGPPPHVFGEMVALLWERGHVTGALALEDLWNELAVTRSFQLSCAYPITVFGAGDDDAFRSVCQKHSSVTPTESYTQALERRQHELESSLQELQHLERLRTEFVAMVVHDLQSPVGVVATTLELLQDAQLSDEENQQLLGGATQGTRQIQRLVEDLSLSLQLESGEFTFDLRPGNLSAVVARSTSDVQAATGRAIELDLPFDLPKVMADEDRQVQVLTNLLTNAVKFSSPDTDVRVSAEADGQRVVVHVSNRGAPIPNEDQDRIFQPFSRLRPATPGTGLGLYIAHELVVGQGGEIWVTSDDEATTFSYSLVKAPSDA